MRIPLAAAIAALLFLGCAKASVPISAEPRDDGGPPPDTDVMAYLSEARALHHLANLSEDGRDIPGAIAPLERLVHAKKPHEGTKVPEVEEVLADTFARLAELRLRTSDLTGAEGDVRAGLTHAPEPTYFRGHLLEVSGVIAETHAGSLADAGRGAEADQARAHARELLSQAVQVQDEVLAHATDGGTEGGHR
jgi:hypothetical protein